MKFYGATGSQAQRKEKDRLSPLLTYVLKEKDKLFPLLAYLLHCLSAYQLVLNSSLLASESM